MTDRGEGERGSVLMLMPAAVLVLIVLGAIAVDLTIVLLGEREAASLAAGAANDAATAALDEAAFRDRGVFALDTDRARRVVLASVGATSSVLDDLAVEVSFPTIEGVPAVRVTVRGTVGYVFAPAIPGAAHTAEVEASATAVARIG